MRANKLKIEYRKKLLESHERTCLLAIEMKKCSEQNVIKLIKTDSTTFADYEKAIRIILQVKPSAKIFENRDNKIKL